MRSRSFLVVVGYADNGGYFGGDAEGEQRVEEDDGHLEKVDRQSGPNRQYYT